MEEGAPRGFQPPTTPDLCPQLASPPPSPAEAPFPTEISHGSARFAEWPERTQLESAEPWGTGAAPRLFVTCELHAQPHSVTSFWEKNGVVLG